MMIISTINFPRNSNRGFPKACPGYKYITPDILLMASSGGGWCWDEQGWREPMEVWGKRKTLPWGEDPDAVQFSSVQFSRSVVSDSLRPHESQHARPPCSHGRKKAMTCRRLAG